MTSIWMDDDDDDNYDEGDDDDEVVVMIITMRVMMMMLHKMNSPSPSLWSHTPTHRMHDPGMHRMNPW